MSIEDTLVVGLSDFHSGGSTALFPNRVWHSKDTEHNHTPTHKQRILFKHYDNCARFAREARKSSRLIIVHDGDAIDGYHHETSQVVTQNKDEQKDIHIELMDYFLQKSRFNKKNGDELYYISGTETHVGANEQEIAKDLGAKRNPQGGHIFNHLELKINNRILWFAHHGRKRGAGANEGNGLRNFLRDVYFDCLKRNTTPPDYIITGHTHTPTWTNYIARERDGFRKVQGIILPSWQMKTRYAYKVAPVEVNEIGAVFLEIRANGEIPDPKFLLLNT